jgi:hypothetical protein
MFGHAHCPDHLLAKPDRAGSSPRETVIGAGRGRRDVVRGCPLGTGQDRYEWHASGTAVWGDLVCRGGVGSTLTVGEARPRYPSPGQPRLAAT